MIRGKFYDLEYQIEPVHFLSVQLWKRLWLGAQTRQSAKLFSCRHKWDSPNASPAGECPPPPLVPEGGANSLAREGVGESQFRRGDRHCGTLYLRTYFVVRFFRKKGDIRDFKFDNEVLQERQNDRKRNYTVGIYRIKK